MPEFPGGTEAMMKYLSRNIKYPQTERDSGVSGTVYINFIIDKSGAVTEVKPLREVKNGPGLTNEAVRVIKSMPSWKPAMQGNDTVRVSFTLPIKFNLEKGRK
jgi:protein TonB